MATFSYARNLRGYQITLTLANTNYNLWTLLSAIDSLVPIKTRELNIQNDGGVGATVLLGDVNISASRYGTKLLAGDSRSYQCRPQMVDIQDFYLRSDTATTLVNIEMVDF